MSLGEINIKTVFGNSVRKPPNFQHNAENETFTFNGRLAKARCWIRKLISCRFRACLGVRKILVGMPLIDEAKKWMQKIRNFEAASQPFRRAAGQSSFVIFYCQDMCVCMYVYMYACM